MSDKIITITGFLGSGKSTVARMLADQWGWLYYSTGMAQRAIAKKRGVSTVELNRLAIADPTIDHEIDAVFKNPPWGEKPCIVDSRLAFHFIPKSFKVCLRVDPEVAAERIFKANRASEKYKSVQETAEYLKKRRQLEIAHFTQNYHINVDDDSQFDLIIDTTSLSPKEVCQRIIKAFG